MKSQNDTWQDAVSRPESEGYDSETGKRNKLPEDHDSPSAATDASRQPVPLDRPITDSNIDFHEAYDVGEVNATGVWAHDETHSGKDQALYGGQ